jgi:hypothetical protein
MAERRDLPGMPSTTLVRKVTSILREFLGCHVPGKDAPWTQLRECWHAAWEWAWECEKRDSLWRSHKRRHWPRPNEIATQYIMLCLAHMKTYSALKLPYSADQVRMPLRAAKILGELQMIEDHRSMLRIGTEIPSAAVIE